MTKMNPNFYTDLAAYIYSPSSTISPILQTPKAGQKQIQEKVAYCDIITMENLGKALDRTKSGVAAGIDGEIKSNFDTVKLEKLYKELKSQKYKPKPTRRVGIPKPDGKTRYLGISSQRDKIVQAAILNLLEKRLDPRFSQLSYGFRPGFGCHDALKQIKLKWRSITWIINVDIKKYFDNIHHKKLIALVSQHCDQATTELINKLLKVGYVDVFNLQNSEERTRKGTPQGSLISPILSNLYLDQLDNYVEQLLTEYNRGHVRTKDSQYVRRENLDQNDKELLKRYPELKRPLLNLKHNRRVKSGEPSLDMKDPNFRRLHYIRYADDFILGFSGPKLEAEHIKHKVVEYLSKELSLETNVEKSSIKHASDKGIHFLGVFLRMFPENRISRREDSEESARLRAVAYNKMQLRIPLDKLLLKAEERGYATKRGNGALRASAHLKITELSDIQIVTKYSSIIRGLVNYYSCVNSRSDLWKILWIYKKSCALTLAKKYKLPRAAKVYQRFGPNLKVSDGIKQKVVLFYPESLATKVDFRTGQRSVSLEMLADKPIEASYRNPEKTSLVCQFENCTETEGLEEHHINPRKNIDPSKSSFEKARILKQRKTITLCRTHHMMVHSKTVE